MQVNTPYIHGSFGVWENNLIDLLLYTFYFFGSLLVDWWVKRKLLAQESRPLTPQTLSSWWLRGNSGFAHDFFSLSKAYYGYRFWSDRFPMFYCMRSIRHICFYWGGRGHQGPWFKNSTLYMTFFCIFLSFPVSQEMKMKIQNFAHRYVPKRKWLKYPTALRFRWSFLV